MTQPNTQTTAQTTERTHQRPLPRRTALQWFMASGCAPLLAGVTDDAKAQQFATRILTQLTPLAPGVYAYLQRSPPGESDFAVANTGVIDLGDSLLAIDATAAPIHVARFMAAAKQATGKAISKVVLTHFHGDHVHGLSAMGPVEVIAQEQCRALLALQDPTSRPQGWQRRSNWATGKEPFRLVLPSVTFQERMSVYGKNGRHVQLLWLGRAHTAGDTCVHLPAERIAFIGDIGFFGVTPLMGNGYTDDWISACERLLDMNIDTFVPGHGPVGGAQQLSDIRDYLRLLQTHARQSFAAGLSPARAAASADLGRFAHWKDADRVLDNVVRMYAEFKGTATPMLDRQAAEDARREYQQLIHHR